MTFLSVRRTSRRSLALGVAASLAGCGEAHVAQLDGSALPDAAPLLDAGGVLGDAHREVSPDINSGVVSFDTASRFEAEPTIVRRSDGVLVAAWMDLRLADGRYSISYAFADPGSALFGPITHLELPAGHWGRTPSLDVSDTDVGLTWLEIEVDSMGARRDVHVMTALSPNGASTFGEPFAVSDDAVAVRDAPSSVAVNGGRRVVSYAEGGALAIAVVDGATITRQLTSSLAGYPSLCGNGADRFYQVSRTERSIRVHVGTARGEDWSAEPIEIASDATLAFARPRCAASGNHVWVTFGLSSDPASVLQEGRQQALSDLVVMESNDGGGTFAMRHSLPLEGAHALLPQIAVANEEAFVAAYVDSGEAEGGALWVARGAGNAWQTRTVPVEFQFTTLRMPPSWVGDSFGLSADALLRLAYVNNTTEIAHVAVLSIDPGF